MVKLHRRRIKVRIYRLLESLSRTLLMETEVCTRLFLTFHYDRVYINWSLSSQTLPQSLYPESLYPESLYPEALLYDQHNPNTIQKRTREVICLRYIFSICKFIFYSSSQLDDNSDESDDDIPSLGKLTVAALRTLHKIGRYWLISSAVIG